MNLNTTSLLAYHVRVSIKFSCPNPVLNWIGGPWLSNTYTLHTHTHSLTPRIQATNVVTVTLAWYPDLNTINISYPGLRFWISVFHLEYHQAGSHNLEFGGTGYHFEYYHSWYPLDFMSDIWPELLVGYLFLPDIRATLVKSPWQKIPSFFIKKIIILF
jgi:hypothetical protein